MEKEAKDFQVLLQFEKDRKLIGVKFLYSKKEYEDCNVKEGTHQMFFCMMVKAAAIGHSLKVRKEHIYCSAASESLGFSSPDLNTVTGRTAYCRGMYETEAVAKEVYERVPYIEHDVYGMVIQPLEVFESDPHVVLAFCIPYTAMRIIQGYSYKYGTAKNIRFVGMSGVCTELMAEAYKNHDISLSFLCSGTRFAGAWRDEEVGVAFPYDIFLSVLDGVKKTANIFEPDDKKEKILQRAGEKYIGVELEKGKNYHGSSLGVARMGVVGYRPKRGK